jgi:hypothetical protein
MDKIMKNLKIQILTSAFATLSMITLTSIFASANLGPGSGNGNGDGAFALQKIAQENPGLAPHEILLKAFHESEGRIPKIKYVKQEMPDCYIGQIVPDNFDPKTSLAKITVINLGKDDLSPVSDVYRRHWNMTYSVKVVRSNGPLLANTDFYYLTSQLQFDPKDCMSETELQKSFYPLIGAVSSVGLVYEYSKQKRFDMRSFANDMIIYVTYPFYGNKKAIPDGPKEYYCDYQAEKMSSLQAQHGICSIGYIWLEKE